MRSVPDDVWWRTVSYADDHVFCVFALQCSLTLPAVARMDAIVSIEREDLLVHAGDGGDVMLVLRTERQLTVSGISISQPARMPARNKVSTARSRVPPVAEKMLPFTPWSLELERVLEQHIVADYVPPHSPGVQLWLPSTATVGQALVYMWENHTSGVPIFRGDEPLDVLELADVAAFLSTSTEPEPVQVCFFVCRHWAS